MRLMMQSCNMKNLLVQSVQNAKKKFPHSINLLTLCLFLGEFLHKNQNYISFWTVCGNIFVFCHGQSAIEGFSDNKQLLVEDLQEKSLVSKQAVYDLSTQRKLKFKSMIVQVIFSKLQIGKQQVHKFIRKSQKAKGYCYF